jgi:predicted MFS family arabinose efflux permease
MPPETATMRMAQPVLPIGLMATAAFLSSAGARVIDPLLHVIATDFATTVPAVSIVVAAFTLPYGLCQVIVGPLGDRFGKLRVMLAALIAYAAATAACALAGSLPMLTLLRVGAGAASAGLIPVGLAYIGDAVPYEFRQVTLSRFLTGVVLAQIMAGPLGGIFGDEIGWRGVFLLLAASAVVAAAALGRRIRRLPDRRDAAARISVQPYLGLARMPFPRRLLLASTADGMLMVGCFPFLAPYMHEAFGIGYALTGAVLSCFGLGALAYTRLAKILVPLLGEPNMVLVGAGLMSGGMALAITTPYWLAFTAVEAALGLGFFLFHGVIQARATEMMPNARATSVGAFVFMLFIGQSVGALAAGALIATMGYRSAFAIDGALILALGLACRRLVRPRSE